MNCIVAVGVVLLKIEKGVVECGGKVLAYEAVVRGGCWLKWWKRFVGLEVVERVG